MTNAERYVEARPSLDALVRRKGGELEACEQSDKRGVIGFSYPRGRSKRKYIVRFTVPGTGSGTHTDDHIKLVQALSDLMLDCFRQRIDIAIEVSEEKS